VSGSHSTVPSPAASWWRSAVVYQIYLRSFCDSNGDGLGDIPGIISKLDYLQELGVDAIWINPWYPSPQADAGYDVITYRDIDPRFGTLADADQLIAACHRQNLKVIVDLVPNHTSDQHVWFQDALRDGPGSASRERYFFRSGKGPNGELPPNDWQSIFGGPAWTRVTEPSGNLGEWYLHLFAPEQPDRNWANPDTMAEFEETLRFWFDRGVDGFRIDVAHGLVKDPNLPNLGDIQYNASETRVHPYFDRDEVHDIYRQWRKIADDYQPGRVFVAEAMVPKPARLAHYVRPDELHTTFNFDYLVAAWRADALRAVISDTIECHEAVGAPPTWVLSNHDMVRHLSRFARANQRDRPTAWLEDFRDEDPDLELGARRARASIMLSWALPGSCYIYQGEELGLPEVENLAPEVRQDPVFFRTNGELPGRDGARVPLPWREHDHSFGFSPPSADQKPWLPQPANFAQYAADRQFGDPTSMLNWYRTLLRLRAAHPALGDGDFKWLPSEPDVLAFERSPGFRCLVNFGASPLDLPPHQKLLSSSIPLDKNRLPPDGAAWLEV
jgi:alpha-glucosidase